MKKIMIALIAAAITAGVQAASVSWKMGTGIKPDGSSNAASGTLNMYVWVVDAATYASTDIASIWGTYGNATVSSISGYNTSVTGKGGAAGGTASYTVDVPSSDTTYYGIVITTYDSNTDGTVDMYAANKVTTAINTAGTASGGANSSKYLYGTTSSGSVTWTAVPEPTSAMLFLLGVAGLALKRKNA